MRGCSVPAPACPTFHGVGVVWELTQTHPHSHYSSPGSQCWLTQGCSHHKIISQLDPRSSKGRRCLFGVKFRAGSHSPKAQRSFTVTQTGPALKTSSQIRAAPLESGCDPFPAPRDTARCSQQQQQDTQTPPSHIWAPPGLKSSVFIPKWAVSSALDTPWWPQSLDMELG